MKNWQQKIRFLFGDLTLILVVLGFLVLINFLSYRHFLRLDLTENEIYTLSESSRRVVGKLGDPLTIQCFFSKKAPPELGVIRQQIIGPPRRIPGKQQRKGQGDLLRSDGRSAP